MSGDCCVPTGFVRTQYPFRRTLVAILTSSAGAAGQTEPLSLTVEVARNPSPKHRSESLAAIDQAATTLAANDSRKA